MTVSTDVLVTPNVLTRWGLALAFCAALAVAAPAWAGLGQSVASVAEDQRVLHGQSLAVRDQGTYQVHEITMASGARVREYVTPTGQVFGLAWSGHSLPNLRQLLASHFAQYTTEAAKRRTNHKVLVISSPQLQLQVVKLPRGFAGTANVPTLLPAGTSAAEIR